MINSSIMCIASRLFKNTGEQVCEAFTINTSFDILESLQNRFAGVGDMIEILRAAIQYTQRQKGSLHVTQAPIPGSQVDTISTNHDFPTTLSEVIIIAKAMSFIDRAYFKLGLSEWIPDQSLDNVSNHSDAISSV